MLDNSDNPAVTQQGVHAVEMPADLFSDPPFGHLFAELTDLAAATAAGFRTVLVPLYLHYLRTLHKDNRFQSAFE